MQIHMHQQAWLHVTQKYAGTLFGDTPSWGRKGLNNNHHFLTLSLADTHTHVQPLILNRCAMCDYVFGCPGPWLCVCVWEGWLVVWGCSNGNIMWLLQGQNCLLQLSTVWSCVTLYVRHVCMCASKRQEERGTLITCLFSCQHDCLSPSGHSVVWQKQMKLVSECMQHQN